MRDDLVSVIIPTFNHREFLQVAMDSVLRQTYRSFELIVVDDGSTDGTGEMVRNRYGDKVTYLWQENSGESVARNRGLSLARGQYVAFLDADDYWAPSKLACQVRQLTRSDADTVAGTFSPVWLVDPLGRRIESNPRGRIKTSDDLTLESLLSHTVVYAFPSNVAFRTDYLKQIGGFDESIHYGEDRDLLLRICARWKLDYIDNPLLYYRVHDANQSKNMRSNQIGPMLKDRLRIIQNVEQVSSLDRGLIQRSRNRAYISAASWSFYYKQNRDGARYLGHVNGMTPEELREALIRKIAYVWAEASVDQGDRPLGELDAKLYDLAATLQKVPAVSFGPASARRLSRAFLREVVPRRVSIASPAARHMLLVALRCCPQAVRFGPIASLLGLK